MTEEARIFANALAAWEAWHLDCFAAREERLRAFGKALPGQLSEVVSFHLREAQALLAAPIDLKGATGETNELYAVGRGVTLIIVEDGAGFTALAFLTAALAAGNSVIIASDDRVLCATLNPALACFPYHLVQLVSYALSHELMESDPRCVAYVGNSETERRINRHLADREGAIVALCSETDLQATPLAHDPFLSLRFVTERVRTIDVTAVGGNATLLASGGAAQPFVPG